MESLIWINLGLTWITIFRFIMYVFALEMNTKGKISAQAWENLGIQEVSYEWTKSLRMLFGFRLLTTFAVCFAGDVNTNWIFLIVTLIFNFYFLLYITGVTGPGLNGGKVVSPGHKLVPYVLTTLDFLGPLFFVAYFLFFNV